MNQHLSPVQERYYPVIPPHPLGLVVWLWLPLFAVTAITSVAALHEQHPATILPCIGLVALIGVGASIAFTQRRVHLRGNVLQVRATFLSRRVPVASMRPNDARIIALSEHNGFKPTFKTLGFGYPGFHAGYYRTRDSHKAFCLITADRILAIPLQDGRWLLLSVEQPRQLLQDLQAAATAQASVNGASNSRHVCR
ncbi:hypothetical protein XACN24_04255 [Xanthomonas albilineans]|uniref:Bacterial Pleckstrin homology domain-containing protein n=1 Tax=Xanthomonas albilineans (strain GPE PC73 / CFBP 7063) TaxID=380358 RepID=D2UD10_XANAP|nr:hypothetical protein [Xanthomonas albilineans]QHQ27633.1 hypothetical protein XaFJ1_GM000883 [Xanthomonas albilineans]CBA15420.1 hypothetical protein XALC_0902 [Xanthomonas albilineans GPE PC73]